MHTLMAGAIEVGKSRVVSSVVTVGDAKELQALGIKVTLGSTEDNSYGGLGDPTSGARMRLGMSSNPHLRGAASATGSAVATVSGS